MWRQRNPVLDEIEPEIAQMLEAFGYELVLAELKGPAGGQSLTLYVDKPGGMHSSDCAEMAKKVSVLLETIDSSRHNYEIVISSPGVDRPLARETDFERFAGEMARLTLEKAEGRQTLTGTIKGLTGSCVVMQIDGDTVEIALSSLVAARLVPEQEL